MKIEYNELEMRSLQANKAGDEKLGHELEDQFVAEFREYYARRDHCPCKKPCKYHGKCMECVAIHRAHRDHLPDCFHAMVNERVKAVSDLTQGTAFVEEE